MTSHTTDLSGLIIPQTFTKQSYFKHLGNLVEVREITHRREVKDVNHQVPLLMDKAGLPLETFFTCRAIIVTFFFSFSHIFFKRKAKIRSDASKRCIDC